MCLDRTSTSIYVVRHAEAGERTDGPDDHLRPLSGAGRHQARSVATMFESADVGDILSSPYVRCVETLEPLADRLGCSVERTDALAEGAPIDSVLRLLEQVPPRSVLCTHGDVMHDVMEHVAFADSIRGGSDRLAKGVVWVMQRGGDGLSVIEVLAAPATCLSIAGAEVEFRGHQMSADDSNFNLHAVGGVAG
jgi:8-oxo-dGTP diphosphatase